MEKYFISGKQDLRTLSVQHLPPFILVCTVVSLTEYIDPQEAIQYNYLNQPTEVINGSSVSSLVTAKWRTPTLTLCLPVSRQSSTEDEQAPGSISTT